MRTQPRIPNDVLPPRSLVHGGISTADVVRCAVRNSLHGLVLGVGLIVSLFWPQASTRAQAQAVEIVTQDNAPLPLESANWVQSFPRIQIFTQFHTGYDDNSRTNQRSSGSWFTNEQLTASYQLPHRSLPLGIVAGIGSTNYLGQRTDTNAFFDLSLSKRVAPRLTLNISLDARYQAEPDLATNVSLNRFSGSYFSIDNRFWANYDFTRRFSAVSSYNFHLLRYENDVTAAFTDREEHTFGEQLRFKLTRTTVLTGEYRFSLVDYVTAPLDSTTHFFLAGIEHRFNSRLRAQARVGASIRSYSAGGSQTNPDFESSLEYIVSRHTSLSWNGSYSVEQPQQQRVVTQKSFRTGLQVSHSFTGRISSSLDFSYSHEQSQQGTSLATVGPAFDQDVFSISLRGRYQIRRRLAFDASYEHSEVSSGRSISQYARNRISGGLSYSF